MLWVTEQTVKFHLSNIYRKLDVANRTEASRWAQVNGLLEVQPDDDAHAGARFLDYSATSSAPHGGTRRWADPPRSAHFHANRSDADRHNGRVFSPAIENLVAQLTRLPGVGTRTAHRLAFHLLRAPKDEALELAGALQEAKERVRFCTRLRQLDRGGDLRDLP